MEPSKNAEVTLKSHLGYAAGGWQNVPDAPEDPIELQNARSDDWGAGIFWSPQAANDPDRAAPEGNLEMVPRLRVSVPRKLHREIDVAGNPARSTENMHRGMILSTRTLLARSRPAPRLARTVQAVARRSP